MTVRKLGNNFAKKTFILQIGYPKTGTTTLQGSIFPRLDKITPIQKIPWISKLKNYLKSLTILGTQKKSVQDFQVPESLRIELTGAYFDSIRKLAEAYQLEREFKRYNYSYN